MRGLLSIGQPELNPYQYGPVHGAALAACGTEAQALNGGDGAVVEAVAQAMDHAEHLDAPVGAQTYLEYHFPLDMVLHGIGGVGGLRPEQHLRRLERARRGGGGRVQRSELRPRGAKYMQSQDW